MSSGDQESAVSQAQSWRHLEATCCVVEKGRTHCVDCVRHRDDLAHPDGVNRFHVNSSGEADSARPATRGPSDTNPTKRSALYGTSYILPPLRWVPNPRQISTADVSPWCPCWV